MVLVGHSQRLAEPLTPRQRRAMKTAGVIFALAAVAIGVWIATHKAPVAVSSKGCVSVVVAGATGTQEFHECGAAARSWCKTEFARHDYLARKVQPECLAAGIRPQRPS